MTNEQIARWAQEHMPAKLEYETKAIQAAYEVYDAEYIGEDGDGQRDLIIPADENGNRRDFKDEEATLLVYLKDNVLRFGNFEECISYWVDE